jgi:two-component system, LytTR family, sensor kinase
MKTLNRFFSQVLFWLLIWLILWSIGAKNIVLLGENIIVFLFQICLIGGIVYVASPFLFLKKRAIFYWLSLGICILVFSFLSAQLLAILGFEPTHPTHPRFENRPPGDVPMPSRFFINFLTLSITALVSIVIETYLFAENKERENILSKNEMLQTELKLLKSQINPHFLFNTLNNIYTLSVIDSNKTQQSIAYLSTMLRYVLYDCEQAFVHIHQELNYIENYLALFSLKSTNPFSISFDKSIDHPNTKIAPMLLIPFIENALKHSNIEKRGTSFIHIKISEESGSILLVVENSKPIKSIQKDGIGGIGLENVSKRLTILYPKKHSLSIIADADTFKVNLMIDGNETA